MSGANQAFNNPSLIKAVHASKYYRPVVLTSNNNNDSILGLRSGKLWSQWSLFLSNPPCTFDWDSFDISVANDIFVEFRNIDDQSENVSYLFNNGFARVDWLNIRVEINGYEALWSGLNESKRRQVCKSLKNGAKISVAKNINEVKQFYNILKTRYQKKIHKPIPVC